MYFYIFHQINQVLRKDEDADGSVNVRTLILGGIMYIITHAIISNPNSSMYLYKNYLLYFFLLDVFAMGIIYKKYYGRSILKEMNEYDTDIYDEKNHKYIPSKAQHIYNHDNKIKETSELLSEDNKTTTTSISKKSSKSSKSSKSKIAVIQEENKIN